MPCPPAPVPVGGNTGAVVPEGVTAVVVPEGVTAVGVPGGLTAVAGPPGMTGAPFPCAPTVVVEPGVVVALKSVANEVPGLTPAFVAAVGACLPVTGPAPVPLKAGVRNVFPFPELWVWAWAVVHVATPVKIAIIKSFFIKPAVFVCSCLTSRPKRMGQMG